jgi:methyl-accepting chemotaxis protein
MLKSLISKIFRPLYVLLSNIRVAYQILIIIILMAVFLVVEGLLALDSFNKMQAITQKVFGESVQGYQSISSIKRDLYTLQRKYLHGLSGLGHYSLNFDYFETISLEASTPDIQETHQRLFAKLKSICARPLSKENYTKFYETISLILTNLQRAEDNIGVKTTSQMERGNIFFNTSRNTNILLLIISLIFSLSIGFTIATMISRPLKEMVAVAGSLATGDFTKNLKSRGNLEVNQLVSSLNNAIMSLRVLIANINEQAQNLAKASNELSDASNEAGKASTEVARAVEGMAEASANEANQISQTVINVTQLGDLVEKVSQNSLKIADSSKQVAQSAQQGQQISNDVASEIGNIYGTTKEISLVIQELNQSSEKIKRITQLIGDIAEKTTLLALNAAIEAARAGEHGKGFSVVAKETGKLAEQSKQASNEITDLIMDMLKRTSHAVNVIKTGVSEVEAGKTLTTQAAITFNTIFKQLEATLTKINDVANSAQEMASHNGQVIQAITSVAAISQEGAATTEEISATMEEQNATAEEVAVQAGNLSKIAEFLKHSVAQFKI